MENEDFSFFMVQLICIYVLIRVKLINIHANNRENRKKEEKKEKQ